MPFDVNVKRASLEESSAVIDDFRTFRLSDAMFCALFDLAIPTGASLKPICAEYPCWHAGGY